MALTPEEEQRKKDLANYSANLQKSDAEYMAVKGSPFDPITGKLLSAPVFDDGTPVGRGLGSGKGGSGLSSGKGGSGLSSGKGGSGLSVGEKKNLLNSPLLRLGSGTTLDKTFPDNLSPYDVLGTPYKSDYTPASTPAPNADPNKSSLFGASSVSSLSGGAGNSGSSSSLNAPTRALGTESGAMRREARRLRKQGYGKAAEQMAMSASMARLNEPKILTQAQRGAQALQAKESDMAAQEAAAAQAEESKYLRDLYRRGRADLANK